MPIQLQEILSSLPPVWPDDLLPAIQRKNAQSPASIVVLDDDPTGTQTVHDVPVLTNWKLKTITGEFAGKTPLFYLLTNSRSLTEAAAVDLALEVGANIYEASRQTGRAFEIISRSDSTLRGHFPAEVDALADVLEMQQAVCVIIPFFQEGGRYTINDIHYVGPRKAGTLSQGQQLIPAADTAFARDVVFGYCNSDLKRWVEEKTQGRISATSVRSLSLEEIRRDPARREPKDGPDHITEKLARRRPGIAECKQGSVCIVNAADYRDLEVVTLARQSAWRAGLARRPAGRKTFSFSSPVPTSTGGASRRFLCPCPSGPDVPAVIDR
ncbi:MAG: four-carbon acid sugar kinase family protein [Phycisphaerae bacterium]